MHRFGNRIIRSSTARVPTTIRVAPRSFTATKKLQPHSAGPVYKSNSSNNGNNSSSSKNKKNNKNLGRGKSISVVEEAWVQLYIQDVGKSGYPFSIDFQSLPKKRIQELAEAVYKKMEKVLPHCSSPHLAVYKAGTKFPPDEVDKLRPALAVPQDTSDEIPLRVVAPAIAQQQDPAGIIAGAKKIILKKIDDVETVSPLEVAIPELEEEEPPPKFTTEPEWLNTTCHTILTRLKQKDTGTERVPPLCVARCSHGGKTRALYEVANKLKELLPDTAVIFVTFNDFSKIQAKEQLDPVGALCRRIAFAALKGRNFQNSDVQYKDLKQAEVGKEWVEKWLGNTPCILLIDELNLIQKLGTVQPFEESLSGMLKRIFLRRAGRYFVFSSNTVTINDQLSNYMDTSWSGRSVILKSLPLISSLSAAVENLSSTLTAHKVIFYGRVPALMYTGERGLFPLSKRQNIIDGWIANNTEKITAVCIVRLLTTLVTGDRDYVPKPLMQFMDVTDKGFVLWIPFHMAFIFEMLRNDKDQALRISPEMRRNLGKVADLFYDFRDAKVESGDGWEAIFVLTLLVRALAGQHHELMGITTIHAGTQVRYDEPYNLTSGVAIDQEKNLTKFLANVPKKVKSGPQLSLYYPQHASFQSYDCFLVAWDDNGKRSHIIGYQLKEGKAMPRSTSNPKDEALESISRRYWIRGEAPQNEQNASGWLVPTKEHLNEFFGVSGKEWTPEKWKT